jgi:transcription elongation factor GreA
MLASVSAAAASFLKSEIAAVAFFELSYRNGKLKGFMAVSEEKELSGKEKIVAELKTLEYELTIELPRALRTAAALGDLSENSEYKYARERQDYVRARVRQLQQQLAKLSSIDLSRLPTDRASYGSTLVLRDLDRDTEVTYRLVTPEEADFEKGLISTSSPIGKSLLNKEEGDEVKVQTPNGTRLFEIVKLATIHDEE